MTNKRNIPAIFTPSFLKELSAYDIIHIDSVLDMLMSKRREQIKKIHTYAITPPCKEGGRWQTSYKGEDGKRKNIKAQTEEELLDKLIPLYFSALHIDKMVFHELYEEWLEYKKSITDSPNTIKRHQQHYHKYFESSVLHSRKVNGIDELFLEAECNRIVKEYNLSRKEWGNIKTILNGMFEYAARKRYLAENLMSKVKIYVKFKQIGRASCRERVCEYV